ncbi:MAG: VOC family protein [Pseudomonadales bacterium]
MSLQRIVGGLVLVLVLVTLLAAPGMAESERAATPTYLSTVIIYTPDMHALAAFYQEALELGDPDTELENHIGFWLGQNYLGFEPVAHTAQNPGGPTVWFGVASAEATLARLVGAGARQEQPPTRQDWGDVHAAARDPDGNLVGLIQRAEGK